MTIETIVVREIKRLLEQKKYYEGQIRDVNESIEWMKENLIKKGLRPEEIEALLQK